ELTIGHVLTCEMHPDSDHLHVCSVDVGTQTLQIICGAPNVEAGQKVIVAQNGAVLPGDFKIKKAKIRGIESNGMICSLDELGIEKKYHNEDGIHVLPEDALIGGNPLEAIALDDEVMELDLTPNRGDLLSMIGVAYDTAAILDGKVNLPKIELHEISKENPAQVFTQTKGCKSYYARVVENVTISESPTWLKARLIAAGVRPINNVVDISNYVMLEYGQPLHFFDFASIPTGKIVVRDAYENETVVTLDGKLRKLVEEDLVITDGERAVALAGVMGGENTEVESHTKSILIESATFDPIRIRKTSKRLDLRSEASMRFERGLDPKRSKEACDRAAMLLEQLAGGEVLKGVSYFDTHNKQHVEVILPFDKVSSVIGRPYEKEEIASIMKRLGFEYSSLSGALKVQVPSRRGDITTVQDLIEEIVRISGYETVPTTYPEIPTQGGLTLKQKIRRRIRSHLTSLGLDESVTYTLVTDQVATSFDTTEKSLIRLFNPMSEDRSSLRHSLIPSMLEAVQYNAARKLEQVRLFELGRGYTYEGETEYLCGVLTGDYMNTRWRSRVEKLDFFVVKGLVQSVLDLLGIENTQIRKFDPAPAFLHPGIAAEVLLDGKHIGYLGRLHPKQEHERDLSGVYVFELELDPLVDKVDLHRVMKTIPKVPGVERDIAVVVDKNVEVSKLIETIQKAGPKSLEDISVFDLYEGERLGENKKSVALKLSFQDPEKTLPSEDVDKYISKIVKSLEFLLGAQLRG
ncbi:MAG: phenylalanine--tRNA ligase subunit beta, partial [Candidatus Izemoplasmatales bacterium]